MTSRSANYNKINKRRKKSDDEAENSIALDAEENRKETIKITSTDILSRNGSLQIVFHVQDHHHLIQFSKNTEASRILKSAHKIISEDDDCFDSEHLLRINNDKNETSTSISAQEDFDSEITELVQKIKSKAIGNRISVHLERAKVPPKVEVIDLEPEEEKIKPKKRKSVEGNTTDIEKGVSKSVVAEPVSARMVNDAETVSPTTTTTSSSTIDEEEEMCPVGLKNLSMTCFINVILQSLSNSPPFRKFIENLPTLNSDKCSVCSELSKLLSSMWYGRKSIESPMALISAMKNKGIQYEFGIEEDAHWFLQTLIQIMDEELVSELGVEYSIIDLFATNKISELICEHCKKTDTQLCEINTVNTLGLTSDDICTLEECIIAKNTSKIELIKCNLCDSLNVNATLNYSMSGISPPVLCYHFDRYKWTGQILRRATRSAAKAKVQTYVFYPEDFDISSFIKEDPKNDNKKQYKLTAVIVHDGLTPISGHYYAFCYIKGNWYKCDDKNIVEVPRETVFQSNPFMLFYSNLYTPPTTTTTSTTTTKM